MSTKKAVKYHVWATFSPGKGAIGNEAGKSQTHFDAFVIFIPKCHAVGSMRRLLKPFILC